MRCLLINSAEQIVHKFLADDLQDARAKATLRCMQDSSTYYLAVVLRKLTWSAPPPTPTVDDQPEP